MSKHSCTLRRLNIMAITWEKFPTLAVQPHIKRWLTIQSNLGLASATLEAYSRALTDYLAFCTEQQVVLDTANREHIAAFVHNLATRPVKSSTATPRYGLANATMQ